MSSPVATLIIAGVSCQLSALTFGALKSQAANIKGLAQGEFTQSDQLFDAMTAIVHASVLRKHPEVTLAQVEGELDWELAQAAVREVLTASFPQVPAGEPAAESPSGSSTGMPASSI
jgi:hypothetical protein